MHRLRLQVRQQVRWIRSLVQVHEQTDALCQQLRRGRCRYGWVDTRPQLLRQDPVEGVWLHDDQRSAYRTVRAERLAPAHRGFDAELESRLVLLDRAAMDQ